MTTNEVVQRELELYKEAIQRIERHFEEFKQESQKVVQKYLDGFNNILDHQSEYRASCRLTIDDLSKVKERVLLLETYITCLKNVETEEYIRKFKEHATDQEQLKLHEFISRAESRLKFLVGASYLFAASLLTLLVTMIANFINK